MSFKNWGDTNYIDLTTDWNTDPSAFSDFVDAIGNSGLKHSITKLVIFENQTLDIHKVQELLNAKGMAHISVVKNNQNPISK